MEVNKTELAAWAPLYEAAINFKNHRPWEWMYDHEIFGVANPQTGEIGYCSVLGHFKQVYALNVNRGTEGLFGHFVMQSVGQEEGPEAENRHEVLFYQNCLMASFDDRQWLAKEELEIIKALGLRFRGRNAWPKFQDYRPGYFPWFIEEKDIYFLTVALEQALDVVLRCREDKSLIETGEDEVFLVRKPVFEEGGIVWHDTYQEPAPFHFTIPDDGPFDEVGLHRILKKTPQGKDVWEAEIFHYPNPVREGKNRPYFPLTFAVVEKKKGLLVRLEILPLEGYVKEARDLLIAAMEGAGVRPREIRVMTGRAHDVLKPVTDKAGITLKRVERLPDLERMRRHFLSSLIS